MTGEPLFHGSCFTGIGGFDLGAHWAGIETLWQIESNPFCQKVLEKHFPDVKRYGDIDEINIEELEKVNIISGGFPCQPFSYSGNRGGTDDHRWLWPKMFEIVKHIKPRWVICENVPGIINMALDQVLADLESQAYEALPFILPACGLDAWHRRDRVFIIAHADRGGLQGLERGKPAHVFKNLHRSLQKGLSPFLAPHAGSGRLPGGIHGQQREKSKSVHQGLQRPANTNTNGPGFPGDVLGSGISTANEKDRKQRNEPPGIPPIDGRYWNVEPSVGRVADGVPHRVDRIRALGNAVVPQLAFIIFAIIREIEEGMIKEE